MNRKEMKDWVKDVIKKKYDMTDVDDLLKSKFENKEITKKEWDKMLEIYGDESMSVESLKLSFLEKWKLRKGLKKVKKIVEMASKEIKRLTEQTKDLSRKERNSLKELKTKMIDAIVGNKKKEQEGLNNVFDVMDEKTNKEVNREILEDYTMEEIEDLLMVLVETLEKEV